LKNQQEEQAKAFAKQLSQIDDNGMPIPTHPAIAKAFADVKKRLEANMQDYIRFSAYVTHEQKNMLTLLRAKLQLNDKMELMADVDNVVDSLDDILTLGASAKSTDMEIIDAALVCAAVCDEYKRIYSDIAFDFDDSADTQIASKELWVSRALSNLIANAMKYAGGKIEVSVTNQKGSVIITVSDEGNGIKEDELDKLFDYQYRVGQLKKDGYGIGLSLVRHVCDICGGICFAENRKLKGASFYMVFPEALALD
jgi:signal transduction histidine kinase